MFFGDALLNTDEPMGKLYAAAHGRKLNRRDIEGTSVVKYVGVLSAEFVGSRAYLQALLQEQILDNPIPLSLRLSGVLLLGAVNVYAIKLDALLKDSYRALEAIEQTSLHRTAQHQAEHSYRASTRNKNVAAAEKITLQDTTSMFAKYMHMHADAGYLAIVDADSSAFANALSQHDQFANVDVNAMLSSQGDSLDTYEETIPHNLDEFSEPEALRDSSADLGCAPEASLDDVAALPPLSTSKRSGPRRFSKAASATPSRGTSGGLPSADEAPAEASPCTVDNAEPVDVPPAADMPSPDMPDMGGELHFQTPPPAGEAMEDEDHGQVQPELSTPRKGDHVKELGEKEAAGSGSGQEEVAIVDTTAGAVHPESPQSKLPASAPKAGQKSPKPRAKRPQKKLCQLHQSHDSKSVKLPQEQIRLLIKDRSSLNAQLLPLLELDAHRDAVQAASTELPVLLRTRVPSDCDLAFRRLVSAVAAARPVNLEIFQGRAAPIDSTLGGEDEISDGEDGEFKNSARILASRGQRGAKLAAVDQEMGAEEQHQQDGEAAALGDTAAARSTSSLEDPEVLRDATPSVGGQGPDSAIGSVFGTGEEHIGSLTPDARHSKGKAADHEDGTATVDFDEMDGAGALPDFEMPFPDDEDEPEGELESLPLSAADPGDEQSLNPHTISTLRRMEQLAKEGHQRGKRSRDGARVVQLSDLYLDQSREEAARTFYDALVLQSRGYIRIAPQTKAFEELFITLLARA